MIRSVFISFIVLLMQTACRQNGDNSSVRSSSKVLATNDTIIGRKVITNEIAGSAYRTRALGYFLVINGDTSDVMSIFSQAKDDGSVDLYFRNERTGKFYRQKLSELRAILPAASKDFHFDSLRSISMGRLISSGDIAIDITEAYKSKYGEKASVNNRTITEFMMESKLTRDLNQTFENYSRRVIGFSLEKCYVTSKKDLHLASKVERDSIAVPDEIIDCLTWINMGSSK